MAVVFVFFAVVFFRSVAGSGLSLVLLVDCRCKAIRLMGSCGLLITAVACVSFDAVSRCEASRLMGSCGHGLLITAVACVSFAAFIGRYRALFRTSDRHGAACDIFQSAGTVSIVVAMAFRLAFVGYQETCRMGGVGPGLTSPRLDRRDRPSNDYIIRSRPTGPVQRTHSTQVRPVYGGVRRLRCSDG